MTIRTRFAPSPTGFLHLGGARTALFNWLLARRYGGAFVLRIEDTDVGRSTKESIEQILESMAWLGLHADEGPFFQMQRLDRYQTVANQLLERGLAYHCYCSREELTAMRERQRAQGLKPRYDGRCRERSTPAAGVAPVIRFKSPSSGTVHVHDLIRGEIMFDNAELDDLVLLRSDGIPTYNFAVVVDDSDMRITHVVRGDDHLNNTPRQLNIMEALDIVPPQYAHVPMILGSDGSRLSKRHSAVDVLAYRNAGYLSEAVVNYLVRLGWSHGDDEILSLDEMIGFFDLNHVNQSAASFDPDKFLWVNQQWLKRLPSGRLIDRLSEFLAARGIDPLSGPPLNALVEVQRERSHTLLEMTEKSEFIYREVGEYEAGAAKKHLGQAARPVLKSLEGELSQLSEWSETTTQAAVQSVADRLELKMGRVAQPLRVAVTGGSASPGIGETLYLLGADKTLARIRKAIEYTEKSS